MKYNIEKINEIGKMVAEVVADALQTEGRENVLIGDIEMVMREGLLKIGNSALQSFLENADGVVAAEIECVCGGKLAYQRKRAKKVSE